jgi:haloalkane dehalogenase
VRFAAHCALKQVRRWSWRRILSWSASYCRPYAEPGESRRPTLTWPREIPLDGQPEDVAAIGGDYSEWLSVSEVPELFINADSGLILPGERREFCQGWENQEEVTVRGSHFVQEYSPEEIGEAIRAFLARVYS